MRTRSLVLLIVAIIVLFAALGLGYWWLSKPAMVTPTPTTSSSTNGVGDPYATNEPTTMPTSTTDTATSTMPATSTNANPDSPSNSTPDGKGGATSMNTLSFPGILPAAEVRQRVKISTNLGDMIVQVDPAMGPRAASNFVYLVKKNFYNGTIFHRVIPGFMIQGGDPTGTWMGGPGYKFDNDAVKLEKTKAFDLGGMTRELPYYEAGWIAMANAGKNTNGSQFFVMVDDYPLPPDYSVFGKLVQGLDVAQKISQVSRDDMDRPNQEVKMISVEIVK